MIPLLLKIAEDAMPEVHRRLAANAAMEEGDGGGKGRAGGMMGLTGHMGAFDEVRREEWDGMRGFDDLEGEVEWCGGYEL